VPAFYAEWFIERMRAGFCQVPNPFNRDQVARVSLLPEDVDVIVFWTRHPRPLFCYLPELDARGYRYYFQYTLMANPRALDPKTPSPDAALPTFRELAERIGPERVIWRYDPIVLSSATSPDFHRRTFAQIAEVLRGSTRRVVVSLMDVYKKAQKRLRELAQHGIVIEPAGGPLTPAVGDLLRGLAETAVVNGMEIVSCAEEFDLRPYGIRPGKCVDDDYIAQVFGIRVTDAKDPHQRPACGCVVSKDIGMYDSCPFGCRYCYAVTSFELARRNYEQHDPRAAALV
jgi:hypothetical protein